MTNLSQQTPIRTILRRPTFQEAVSPYQKALNRSNFRKRLSYEDGKTPENPPPTRLQWHRYVTLFNTPSSKNVKTNVGRMFLNLIDKNFPATTELHI